jgi:hypothetical protein
MCFRIDKLTAERAVPELHGDIFLSLRLEVRPDIVEGDDPGRLLGAEDR